MYEALLVTLAFWIIKISATTLGETGGDALSMSDFLTRSAGLGYLWTSILLFAVLMSVLAAYFWTQLSHTLLFWSAFILTRPLGVTLGDLLTKPHADGGLQLSRIDSSLIIACILFTSQKPERPAAQHGST